MKKILVTLGIICLTVLSAQANIRISFKGRCPTFADSIKNCCGSIITDSEGNLTCTEICDSGEVCTPAGCCENGTDVYRNASGAYQCCKGTVCGTNCCESGQECMEGNCCQTGQVLCNGECQDKPTVNENNCEKLSDDECSVISKCTDGQECDGAGNCVEAKPDLCEGVVCDESACETCNPETGTCETACGESQTCCSGACCDYGCDGSDSTKCLCLNGESCGKICCGVNESCNNGVCECSDGTQKCGDICCQEGQTCKDGTTCCDIIDKTKCPNGETMIASDGCEICKGESPVCAEEYVKVKNYKNDIGPVGEVCCKVEDDYIYEGIQSRETKVNFLATGAINGMCCSGYGKRRDYSKEIGDYAHIPEGALIYARDENYKIRNNGGIYYCSMEQFENYSIIYPYNDLLDMDAWVYYSDNRWCYLRYREGTLQTESCHCTTSGNPMYGNSCN